MAVKLVKMMKRKSGGRTSREVETDMYTLPERTQPTHKDLLYGTGDSAQYSVTAYPGKESKKEWTHM